MERQKQNGIFQRGAVRSHVPTTTKNPKVERKKQKGKQEGE
jgi:hypothetical protein